MVWPGTTICHCHFRSELETALAICDVLRVCYSHDLLLREATRVYLFSILMKRFIVNTIIFLGILVLAVIPPTVLYIKRDVYCDFGNHKNYSWKYNFQGLGDISTKKLVHSTIPYNSFVFGSSRCVELYA